MQANGTSDHTLTARFPMIEGALNIGPRVHLRHLVDDVPRSHVARSHAAATCTSRAATARCTTRISARTARSTISRGRVAFAVLPTLSIGVAGHVLTGQNQLSDHSRARRHEHRDLLPAVDARATTGHSFSGGIAWRPLPTFSVAASGDVGGTMHATRNDTTLSSAHVPKRFGFGALVRRRLRTPAVRERGVDGMVRDEWSGGVGCEGHRRMGLRSRRRGTRAEPVRAGVSGAHRLSASHTAVSRRSDEEVHETDYSFGFGIPVSRGRSRIDLSLIRSNRTANIPDVSEHAWIMSFGFFVRP